MYKTSNLKTLKMITTQAGFGVLTVVVLKIHVFWDVICVVPQFPLFKRWWWPLLWN